MHRVMFAPSLLESDKPVYEADQMSAASADSSSPGPGCTIIRLLTLPP